VARSRGGSPVPLRASYPARGSVRQYLRRRRSIRGSRCARRRDCNRRFQRREALRRRRDWRALVENRLWTFEKPNPATSVSVQLRESDCAAAQAALRSDRLHPAGVLLTGSPPAYAVDLTTQLRVEEPEAWRMSVTDEHRITRIFEVLHAAGVHARVAGRDIHPKSVGAPGSPGRKRPDPRTRTLRESGAFVTCPRRFEPLIHFRCLSSKPGDGVAFA
jgi:hypothetical protein